MQIASTKKCDTLIVAMLIISFLFILLSNQLLYTISIARSGGKLVHLAMNALDKHLSKIVYIVVITARNE